MGLYIEPNGDKKEWLECEGEKVTMPFTWEELSSDVLPVCIVDNGMFYAAVVATRKEDLDYYNRDDGRPRWWYLVKREKLKRVCKKYSDYINE